MGFDTSVAGAILKEVYEGPLREQINQKTPALKYFVNGDMSDKKWEGNEVVVPLHNARNSGVKAIAIDTGQIPSAGNQGTTDAKIPIRKWMGHIQISADIMDATATDKGAFISAIKLEQDGLVKDISRQRNRGLNYFGQGTLAVISSGANSATQTLKDPGNVVGTTNVGRFVKVGDILAFTDSTGAILRGVQKVTSVTSTTVVLDSAVNTTTGDLVSFGSNAVAPGESSFNLEPYGLLALVDATTYASNIFSINRSLAANAFFQSNVLTSVGALNPDLLNRIIDNNEEVSGEKVKALYGHHSIKREVWKLTEQDKRYNVQQGNKGSTFQAGPAGNDNWGFAGIDGTADRDAAYGTLFFLSEGHLERYELGESGWAKNDGTVFLRAANTDQYEARYRLRENFFNDMPVSCSRADGITATVTAGAFGI